MIFTLYDLAGWAMFAWLLMIFLPSWRVTRWLARSAVFPIWICVLYTIGIAVVLRDTGPGIMQDFGNREGVLRILARTDVALVAWIHILAFDQFAGLWIYRDNLRHRYVPVVVQSGLLLLTLMLGPLGLLTYWLIRVARRAPRLAGGWIERVVGSSDPFPDAAELTSGDNEPATTPAPVIDAPFGPAQWADVDDRIATMPSPVQSPLRYALHVFGHAERALTFVGLLGIALAAGVWTVSLVQGPVIEPEGVLSKPIAFDMAVGIYMLTLTLLVPLARFPRRTLFWWRTTAVILTPIGLAIETVQSLRGIDPRFSQVAGPIDNVIGNVFLTFAIGMIVLFWILAVRFFDLRRPGTERMLAAGVRYAFIAGFLAHAAGVVMSTVAQGRAMGASGNWIVLHGLGFHGLQAIPMVAILVARSALAPDRAMRYIHTAGLAWTFACLMIAIQTFRGLSVFVPTFTSIAGALLLLVWLGLLLTAAARGMRTQATGRLA